MRKILVAGNWKLNGSRQMTRHLLEGLLHGVSDGLACDVLVCPPFVYLGQAADTLKGSTVALGAQNVAAEQQGAYTGEVSAPMLADIGCSHAIVGHSERRSLFGDTDVGVARRFVAAQESDLTPILCVGEALEEREAGSTNAVVERQLAAVLEIAGVKALENAIVAYEPVWAIGTGRTATPAQAQEVHGFIRTMIGGQDDRIGGTLRILYGGSVNGDNAAELFSQPDVDGGLVGGASLKADEFLRICKAADAT